MDTTASPFKKTSRTFARKPLPAAISLATALLLGFPLSALASDKTVLTSLRDSVTANQDRLSSWNSGEPCDGWKGVSCLNNRVTELSLANLDLAARLPAEIKDLDQLTILDLSNNAFSGPIPDDIGELTNLKTLKLDRNAFEGAVPISMKELTALEILNLDYNKLESSNDPDTDSFLTEKQGQDWTTTQTVAPTDLQVTGQTIDSISLSWTPISYTANSGKYEIVVSPDAELSVAEDQIHESEDKTSSSLTIAGLAPSSEYHMAIRTRSEGIPGKTSDWVLISHFSNSVSAYTLLDTDGDGTADVNDSDADGDGISNEIETLTKDTDNDGIKDYLEPNTLDTDGDGSFNYQDSDDDDDGKITSSELGSNPDYPADSDNDGIRDYLDADSKNAGGSADGSGDSDSDGISDKQECPNPHQCADTDGEAPPDYMDQDDDNDGLPTASEGGTLDSDSDGIINALEPNNIDTDGDGLRNQNDADDDGDGTLTRDELGGNPRDPRDKDGDNIPDYLDADSSNKAKTDDGSGDSDGDGISDTEECPAAPACPDADKNGIPSYMDVGEKTIIAKNTGVLGDTEVRSSGGGLLGLPLLTLLSALGLRRRRNHH